MINILKKVSPGTSIRTALDDLLRANIGALIAIDSEGLSSITSGGFRINAKFTPQKLVELAKMDGAIILSDDLKRILYANILLSPKVTITTKETGTRHQAAERTAKQIKTIVIAVSERKKKISIYYDEIKHELENTSEVLRRATETLQILEKQKEIYNDLLTNLNVLEINNLITTTEVCNILQRIEIIKRIEDIVKRYLIELGKEGAIVSMRLKELTKNIHTERELILNDYFPNELERANSTLENMNFDFLIETTNLSRILFHELQDKNISPKGKRILKKTNFLEKDIDTLINNFNTLDKIFDAPEKNLLEIFQNENLAKALAKELQKLREKIMSGKII
jgi:diadenylate cyclase